ncbi:MAG: Thymidylate kinase [Claussenomyces sp. TS43310]|nr:MAG: Thymidylate kinase [Claussenomyces sp. TS43310]
MSSASTPRRGTFIVVEGLDRSGKTTQVLKLVQELRSQRRYVKQIRFPDRTTMIGGMIDAYLQSKSDLEDHVIHLLFSANRWELADQIKSLISQGCTIICDRYYYSGMIYSAAKLNPGLPLSWAREPDVGLPRPDLVIFLDLEPQEAEKRGGFGDEKYERKEMQRNVRRLFYELRDSDGEEKEDMVVVNAGRSIEEVGADVLRLVRVKLDSVHSQGSDSELRTVGKWSSKGEVASG